MFTFNTFAIPNTLDQKLKLTLMLMDSLFSYDYHNTTSQNFRVNKYPVFSSVIFSQDLGTPSEKIWPGFNQLPAVKKMKFNEYPVSNLRAKFNTLSEVGLGILIKFLTYDPNQRVTAEEALKHAYFNEPPLPIDPAMFPTWPAKSELGQRRALAASPKPPSGGGDFKKMVR